MRSPSCTGAAGVLAAFDGSAACSVVGSALSSSLLSAGGDAGAAMSSAVSPSSSSTAIGVATATSHNSILLAAAHYGVLGGVALAFLYLLLVLTALRSVRQTRGSPERYLTAAVGAALFGYLAQDQLNNLNFVPKVATQLWFLIALLPMLVAQARKEEPPAQADVLVLRPPNK